MISKQQGRKDFSIEQLPTDPYKLLYKQKNSFSINQERYSRGFGGSFTQTKIIQR